MDSKYTSNMLLQIVSQIIIIKLSKYTGTILYIEYKVYLKHSSISAGQNILVEVYIIHKAMASG